ncbi:hypothetical protein CALCODRAFT_2351 [Calocera cornea HHB12733]|uniref:Uncharacterized protein n=1 Tax=Calocera cornea HHB12733 TaxID=1353952 RepID=A0A165K8T6_9BASI|nr:hypothetical protein CALCODRAFT_2351 [Calocera cornea HHB12733]
MEDGADGHAARQEAPPDPPHGQDAQAHPRPHPLPDPDHPRPQAASHRRPRPVRHRNRRRRRLLLLWRRGGGRVRGVPAAPRAGRLRSDAPPPGRGGVRAARGGGEGDGAPADGVGPLVPGLEGQEGCVPLLPSFLLLWRGEPWLSSANVGGCRQAPARARGQVLLLGGGRGGARARAHARCALKSRAEQGESQRGTGQG